MNNDRVTTLYNNLKDRVKGFRASEEAFRKMLGDEQNRRNLHANMPQYFPGFTADFDSFNRELGFASETPSLKSKQTSTQTVKQPAQPIQQAAAQQTPASNQQRVQVQQPTISDATRISHQPIKSVTPQQDALHNMANKMIDDADKTVSKLYDEDYRRWEESRPKDGWSRVSQILSDAAHFSNPNAIATPKPTDYNPDPYLSAARTLLMQSKARMEDTKEGEYKFGDITKNTLRHLLPAQKGISTFGMSDFEQAYLLKDIFDKLNTEDALDNPSSVLKPNELALYDAYLTTLAAEFARAEDTGAAATAGKITAEMVQFMEEMAMMNGIWGGFNKAVTNKLARKLTEKIVMKAGKGFSRYAAKAGTGLIMNATERGMLAGESAVSSLLLPRTYANTLNNEIGVANTKNGIDFDGEKLRIGEFEEHTTADAFLTAWRDQWKEMFTETGGLFKFGSNIVFKNPLARRVTNKIKQTQFGNILDAFGNKTFARYAKGVAYDGVFNEWLEEVEGAGWDYMFGDNEAYSRFFSKEQQLPMLISFSIPSLFGLGMNASQEAYFKIRYDKAIAGLREDLRRRGYSDAETDEMIADIKDNLYASKVDELPSTIKGMASSILSPEDVEWRNRTVARYNELEDKKELTKEEKKEFEGLKYALKNDESQDIIDNISKLASSELALSQINPGAERERNLAIERARRADAQNQAEAQEQQGASSVKTREDWEREIHEEWDKYTHSNGYLYEVYDPSDRNKVGYIIGETIPEIDETNPENPVISNSDVVTVKWMDGTVEQLPAKDLNLTGQPQMAYQFINEKLDEIMGQQTIERVANGDQPVFLRNPNTGNIVGFFRDSEDPNILTDDIGMTSNMEEMLNNGFEEVDVSDLMAHFTNGEDDIFAVDNGNGTFTVMNNNGIGSDTMTEQDFKRQGYVRIQDEPANGGQQSGGAPVANGQQGAEPAPVQPPVQTAPIQQPPVEQEPVQQAPAEPIAPDVQTMTADELTANTMEFFGGDKVASTEWLNMQLKIAKDNLAKARRQQPRVTDPAGFRSEWQRIQQEQKTAQDLVSKIEAAKLDIVNYKTKAEQAAEAAKKETDAAKRAARRQTVEGLAGGKPAEKWNAANKTVGNKVTRTLPDGTKISGHYVLVEAGAATPSHNPFNGWNTSEGFPMTEDGRNINDRDYRNDKDAQQLTMNIAQTYDGQAVEQVPVVSNEGIVYDGNGRTIAGHIAASNNTDAAYLQSLAENAANFGFTPEQVAQYNHPRVYLQTDENLPYNTTTFAKFNAQEKKTQSSVNRAVSNSKKMTEATRDGMLRVIDSYGTLDSFFGSEAGAHDIVRLLTDNGIITQQEVPEFTEKTDNGFVLSTEGKNSVTDLLIGALFDEQTIRMLGNDKGLKQSILRALPAIAENRRLGEYALTDNITAAIQLLYEARKAGMAYKLYVLQGNAFDGYVADRYTPFDMLLAEEMSAGVEEFRNVLNLYNNSARDEANGQGGLFEPRSTEDIVNEILTRYGKETKQATGSGRQEPATSTEQRTESPSEQPVTGKETESAAPSAQAGNGQITKQQIDAIEEAFSLYDTHSDDSIYNLLNTVRDVAAGNAEIIGIVDDIQAGLDEEGLGDIDMRDEAAEELRRRLQAILQRDLTSKQEGEQITLTDGRVVTPTTITHADFALLGKMSPIQRDLIAVKANNAQFPDMKLRTAGYLNDTRGLLFNELPDKKSDIKEVEAIYKKMQEEYLAEPNKTEDYRLAADNVLREIWRRLHYLDSDKWPGGIGSALISRLPDADQSAEPAPSERINNETEAQQPAEQPKAESKNTIFTDEAYEKAKARMKARLNRLNMGIDPEMVADQIVIAGYHVERGARKFADFARALIADFGDGIRQYARQMYNYLRDIPEGEPFRAEMDDYATVMAFDIDNFDFKDRMMPAVRKYEDVNGQKITITDVSKGRDGTVYYDLTITEPSGHVRQTSISVDDFNKELESKGIFPANSEKNAQKNAENAENILINQNNLVTLQPNEKEYAADGLSVVVNTEDYKTYLTPQAKEVFARLGQKERKPHARPELSYISFASRDGVKIPLEVLKSDPAIVEAQEKIDSIKDSLQLTQEQIEQYANRLLEGGDIKQERKAFLIIGRPAGGKSSVFAEPLASENSARIIDSDEVKPWLEGYDNGDGAGYVQRASDAVMQEALWRAAINGDNVVIPKIGGGSVIDEITLPLKELGYTVELYYNEVAPESSYMRAMARFAEKGRYLSLNYLAGIGEKPTKTFNNYSTKNIGETINELPSQKVQDLRGRLGRIREMEAWLLPDGLGRGGRGISTLGISELLESEGSQRGRDSQLAGVPLFSHYEWKNNDVPFGSEPKTIKQGDNKPTPPAGPNGGKKATFENGQKVKYKNKVDGKLYDATIDSVNADGTYNLITPSPVFGDMFMGNISEDRIQPIDEPKKESPMQKQYREIKANYPDATLLFRVGDFYEMYDTDAETGSKILGITLTKNHWAKMAGFPFHALDKYLPMLVRAGKRVAICDQLEDPKLTTKTVKRGVTELVTPGEPYQEQTQEKTEEKQPAASSKTIGTITKSKHTKTGEDIYVVSVLGPRLSDDEFKQLKARAKANNGYYSSFAKNRGFIFKDYEDAKKFNNISDEEVTTNEVLADTEAIVSEAETVIAEASAVGSAQQDAGQEEVAPSLFEEQVTDTQTAIDHIDAAVEKVDKQLALLGYYEADETKDFHEYYGYMRSAEKKAVADADKLAKTLADDLGIEVSKRKKIATSNLSQIGGDIMLRLPLLDGKELALWAKVQPNAHLEGTDKYHSDGSTDSLVLTDIIWRVESPASSGMDRYGTNNWLKSDVTYQELLKDIRRVAKDVLPNTGIGKNESVRDFAKKVQEAAKRKKQDKKRVDDGQQMLDLFADAVEDVNKTNEIENESTIENTGGQGGEFETPAAAVGVDGTQSNGGQQSQLPEEQTGGRDAGGVANGNAGETGGNALVSDAAGSQQPGSKRGGSQRPAGGVHAGNVQLDPTIEHHDHRTDDDSLITPNEKNAPKNTRNYLYPEDASDIDNLSPSERMRVNVEALETLRTLMVEGREATPEERAILGKLRGWGGVQVPDKYDIKYSKLALTPMQVRLGEVVLELDPNDELKLIDSLRTSSLTSYYTPVSIARAMHAIAQMAGYRGNGNMLDPSMGNGVFEGSMPKGMQQSTNIRGVELDWLTGQIAQRLYPDARVNIAGFQDAHIPQDYYDYVVSNIPFGSLKITDLDWERNPSPIRKAAQGKIHNYFAVKMIESTRPGGLCVIMTSNAIMDTKGNQVIRDYITDTCEVLGAVRLPNNTFKGAGTKVVTDVIFLRKFRNSTDATEVKNNIEYANKIESPFKTWAKVKLNDKNGAEHDVNINSFYTINPEYVLGNALAGGQYSGDAYDLESNFTTDELANRIVSLGRKMLDDRKERFGNITVDTTTPRAEIIEKIKEAYKGNGNYESSGNITIQDGKIGKLEYVKESNSKRLMFVEQSLPNASSQQVSDYIKLRTALKQLIQYQIENYTPDVIDGVRKQMQDAYTAFVKKYGKLQVKKNAFIEEDIDGFQVRALEQWKDGKFVGMADIYTKNTISSERDMNDVSDPQSAVLNSLAEYGYINNEYLQSVLGDNFAEQCGDLIFEDPAHYGNYIPRDIYLSGDVVSKLEHARQIAEEDNRFQRNVNALEAIQPRRKEYGEFPCHMGARWIPVDIYNDFLKDVFGINTRNQKTGITYVESTNEYVFNFVSSEFGGKAADYGTTRKSPQDIFQAALLDKDITIKYKDEDGAEHTDIEATEAARDKVAALREAFEDWVPQNKDRVDKLTDEYNIIFNRHVLPTYNGQHLNIVGLQGMTLRPHQKDAVWRIINQRGGIVDHIVGAGKSLVMQASIMEMRRMGIAKKPMILALKSTTQQIANEFRQAFPAARVLAPTEADFSVKNRKRFLAQIAVNDYDCIILSHEQYSALDHTDHIKRRFIEEQLAQIENLIQFLYGQKDQSQLTKKQLKGLEKRKANLEEKLKKLDLIKTDEEFVFENLGVDYLFVDECQAFKNLMFQTSYDRVAGLGNPEGSERSTKLLYGIRSLQEMHQGDKGTVFLSGTTITNSLSELYNIFNYLRPNEMKRMGLNTFDAWASTFAVRTTEAEFGVTNELKEKSRFRKFEGLQELSRLYTEIADVRNDHNLELPKPKLHTVFVPIPITETMKKINDAITNMVKNNDGSFFNIFPENRDKYPWSLSATNLAKLATLSPKLINPSYDDENGKIFNVCENIAKIYKQFNDQKGVQLIFCDSGVPGEGKPYDAYTDIINRLVNDYGIPRSEIADIHEAGNDDKRKELFRKVNDGQVRIMIGGTKNMGTGVNVQKRVVAMHHLDIPWTPADVNQRNGRGSRQGNEVARDFNNNQVDAYYYAVERTLDTYRYQLQDVKGKMIDNFKTANVGLDEFDEGSDEMSAAEMVAVLSGNPVILDKAKQDKLVEKLKRAQRNSVTEYSRRLTEYQMMKESKNAVERLIRLNKEDLETLRTNGFVPDEQGNWPSLSVTLTPTERFVSGDTYEKAKEAGEAIHARIKETGTAYLYAYGIHARVVSKVDDNGQSTLSNELEAITSSGIKYAVSLSDDATAAGQAMQNLLKKIYSNEQAYKKRLAEIEHKLDGADPGMYSFPRQAELDEAIAKKREIDAEYNKLVVSDKKPQIEQNGPEKQYTELDYDAENLTPEQQLATDALMESLRDNVGLDVRIATKEEAEEVLKESGDAELMAVSNQILRLFNEAKNGTLTGKSVQIGKLTEDGRAFLEKLSGLSLKEDIDFRLNPSDLNHIYNEHYGSNEKDSGNNVPLNDYDIRKIVDVICYPTEVIYGVDKEGRKLFFFLRQEADGAYNLLEVYADRRGNLTTKTYYKTRKGVSQRVMDITPLLSTSKTYSGSTLSTAKIPQLFETAKFLDKKNENFVENAQLSIVSNEKTLKKLENEPTIKVYRGMALIDGKLYPPMSTKDNNTMKLRTPSELGKWEQSEENLSKAIKDPKTGKYYFVLRQAGKRTTKVAYNPYIHTSRSPLNDQFSAAYDKPYLVTVETEIPASELTSGYHAEGAHNSVGEMDWKSGGVSQKIADQTGNKRKVILSRWAKPVRIVPDSEVADRIADMLKGTTGISIPNNVVTPTLLKELEKRGVQIDYNGIDRYKQSHKQVEQMRTSDGTLYGWAVGNKIYLTPAGLNPNSPIHEYSHVWLRAIQENNPELYKNIKDLFSPENLPEMYKELKGEKHYADLDEDGQLSEVFARFSSKRGAHSMESESKRMMDKAIHDGGKAQVAKTASLIQRMKAVLRQAWDWIGEHIFNIKNFGSREEAADRMLYDLLNKTPLKMSDTFYSNAERAVGGIKQDKATPEQWLAMITKNGGIKAGEDKWLGLSDWLKEQKGTLTKRQILDYIRANKIQIEEVNYGSSLFTPNSKRNFESEIARARANGNSDESAMEAWDREFNDRLLDAYRNGEFTIDENGKVVTDSPLLRPINKTRLQYTTNGLENNREIALVVPTIESWNENDEIHFGDAGQGKAIAWVRFGDYKWGKGTLVVDEIQSKRHQEGREKGYRETINPHDYDELTRLHDKYYAAEDAADNFTDELRRKYDGQDYLMTMNEEEHAEWQRLWSEREAAWQEYYPYRDAYFAAKKDYRPGPAPFEHNWHELAMKRIIRYAAENGYDKVYFTTGLTQAKRYGMSSTLREVYYKYNKDGSIKISCIIDKPYMFSSGSSLEVVKYNSIEEASKELGRDAIQKIKDGYGRKGYSHDGEDGWTTFSGKKERMSTKGMSAFYDEMLPRFLQKYGKKWGIKLGETEIGYDTYHTFDITPEMRESVMQGQPMFSLHGIGTPTLSSDITKTLVDNAKENYNLMQSALRKVSNDIKSLRAATRLQADLDREQVASLLKLANTLLQAHWGGVDLSNSKYLPHTMATIATQIRNSIGKSDITREVNNIMDYIVDAQQQAARKQWEKLRSTPIDKLNISGVVSQGKVAIQGQHALKAMNEAFDSKLTIEQLEELIAQMAKKEEEATDESLRMQYKGRMIGYVIAAQHNERIDQLIQERQQLSEELRACRANKSLKLDARREQQDAIFEAMRENALAQADAYIQSARDLKDYVNDQNTAAKDFVRRQDENRNKIRSYAQRDLEGVATNPNRLRSKAAAARQILDAIASPIRDLQSMLRLTGLHAPDGEGYLYNHFMRGWTDAADKERVGLVNAHRTIDDKINELTHGKYKTWAEAAEDIKNKSHGLFSITMLNGVDGQDMPITEELSLDAGNALYIYAVNKMTDGKMKLRGMNISEEDVQTLTDAVRAQFGQEIIDVVDWVQREFFSQLRNRYNPTHEALFGAPMDAIENYFPIRINANARQQNEDLSDPDTDASKLLAGTSTGAIKRRTRNSLPLDVRNADFFNEVIRHIAQMERWNAFAQWNRDANILFSDINFRNRIKGMSGTIYGSGDKLYTYMKDAFRTAMGTYKPKTDTFSEITLNIAKGVTSAKINFRVWTALKQIASFPAFFTYMTDGVAVESYLRNWAHPHETMKWAKENLPSFEKRLSKRDLGDMRLMQRTTDWQWNKKMLEWSQKYGMAANVFFDTLTCATGARAVYESKKADYLKKGYSAEVAERRAIQDAEQAFNTSQQSSEGAYMSPVQMDRNMVTAALTVFRTSPIQYTRNFIYHTSNLVRKLKKGSKEEQIEFRRRQYISDGLTNEQAQAAAEKDYNKSIAKDVIGMAVYGALLGILWRLVGKVPYWLFGDDDDKKKQLVEEALTGGAIVSPITGFIGGGIIENALDGYGKMSDMFAPELPFKQDLEKAEEYLGNDKYAEFASQALSVLMQSGVGFDPMTASDMITRVATTFESDDDLTNAQEAGRVASAVLSIPQSQYEQMLIDRVIADESNYDKVLKEYNRYLSIHRAPLTWYLRSDEQQEKADESIERRFKKLLKERKQLKEDDNGKTN